MTLLIVVHKESRGGAALGRQQTSPKQPVTELRKVGRPHIPMQPG